MVVEALTKDFKSFIRLDDDPKKLLLEALGFGIDSEGFVIKSETGIRERCRYTGKQILFKDASVLPGSTVIINTSLITLSQYILDYLEE
jgi:hypothetical protein